IWATTTAGVSWWRGWTGSGSDPLSLGTRPVVAVPVVTEPHESSAFEADDGAAIHGARSPGTQDSPRRHGSVAARTDTIDRERRARRSDESVVARPISAVSRWHHRLARGERRHAGRPDQYRSEERRVGKEGRVRWEGTNE